MRRARRGGIGNVAYLSRLNWGNMGAADFRTAGDPSSAGRFGIVEGVRAVHTADKCR